jgi:glucose-6-phosphate-specific signal transduction histidine kinase
MSLVRASNAFGDWCNVVYWQHHCRDWELRRIDLILLGNFAGCTAAYGWLYGWQGALQGGLMFVTIFALALFLRR